MICPSCRSTIEPGRVRCTTCGTSLWSPVAPTVPVPTIGSPLPPPAWPAPDDSAPIAVHDGPAWQVTPDTEPIPVLRTEPIPMVTAQVPVVPPATPRRRLRTAIVVCAVLAVGVGVAAALTPIGTIEATVSTTVETTVHLDDLGTNLPIGMAVAGVLLLLGSLTAVGRRTGFRTWSGLAGGAALALAGLSLYAVGTTVGVFDAWKVALIQQGEGYTLVTVKAVGFWLAIAAAVLGAAVFVLTVLAVRGAPRSGSRAALTAAAAFGGLGSLAAAIGPLVPMHDASWSQQFSSQSTPPLTIILRVAVLVLLLLGCVWGFASRRSWGLTMALGSASVAVWQTISAYLEVGAMPLSFAGGNPGARDALPHLVTAGGLALILVSTLVGYTAVLARRTASAATR